MSMMYEMKKLFRRLSATEVAASELTEAELNRLKAQTAVEYATSVVSYEDARIKRLRKYLTEQEKQA